MPSEPGTLPVLPDLASEPTSELATLEDKVDSSQPVQGSTKSELYDTIQLKPSAALLAGAQKYREKGIFIGVDGGKYKLFFGDPAGDYVDFNGTTLDISGGISVDTIDIGGSDNTSFHVDIDGNMWLGAGTFVSAPFKVSNTGALTASGVTVEGSVNGLVQVTANQGLLTGDAVAMYSADNVRRCRWTGVTTFGSPTANVAGSNGFATKASRTLDLSSTLKLVGFWSSTSDVMSVMQVKHTQTAISSLTYTAVSSGTESAFDLAKINSTTALFVWIDSNAIKASVLSSLDGTLAQGATQSITGANARQIQVVYIDDSNILIFYRNSSDDTIRLVQCSRSGDTITTGTASTAWSNTDGKTLACVRRFGTTNYMGILVENSTDSEAQFIIGLYDSTAKNFSSIGTEVGFSGEDITGAANVLNMASLSDTVIGFAYTVSGTTTVKARTVSRSGTTATLGTAITLSVAGRVADQEVMTEYINERTLGIQLKTSLKNSTFFTLELASDGTSLVETSVATYTSATDGNGGPGFLLRLNSKQCLFAFCDSPGGNSSFEVGIATMTTNYDAFIGLINANTAAAASGTVIASGSVTILSSLTAASPYYLETGGLITSDSNGTPTKAGVSKDTNEFIVQP